MGYSLSLFSHLSPASPVSQPNKPTSTSTCRPGPEQAGTCSCDRDRRQLETASALALALQLGGGKDQQTVALFNPLYISQTHQPTQLAARPPSASSLLPLPTCCSATTCYHCPLFPAWETRLSTSASLAKFLFRLPTLRHRLFLQDSATPENPILTYLPVPSHPIPLLLPSFPSRLFSLLLNITNTTVILRTVPTYLPRLVPVITRRRPRPPPLSALLPAIVRA